MFPNFLTLLDSRILNIIETHKENLLDVFLQLAKTTLSLVFLRLSLRHDIYWDILRKSKVDAKLRQNCCIMTPTELTARNPRN